MLPYLPDFEKWRKSVQAIFVLIATVICINQGFAQSHCKMDVTIFVLPNFCNPGLMTLSANPFGPKVLPVTYLWSTGETTKLISIPNAAGTYTVTATDNVGCTAVDEVDISNPANFDYFIEAYNTCPGEQAQLIVAWGYYEPPPVLSYAWSTGANTPIIDIPGAGIYSVTLTDGLTGCSQVISLNVVLQPGAFPVITGPSSLCSGQPGTLTVNGGPFNAYYWDPPVSSTEELIITEPGTYAVTVVNDFSCTGTATIEVSSGGTQPVLNGPFEICGGSVTLSVTNASAFSGFLWSTGAQTSSISVNTAGIYDVTVTESGGCTATGSTEVTVNQFTVSGVSTPNTSCNTPNGGVDITIQPFGTYDFTWTGGSNSEDLADVGQGTYTVTVSNGSGCTKTAVFTVTQNLITPVLSAAVTASACGQSNGAANLTVTPASGNTFIWSNGAATEDVNGLPAGPYTVTVTTANNCSATLSATVVNSGSNLSVTGTVTPNTSCTQPNGNVDITVTPAGSYNYAWPGGAITEDLTNVGPGTYTVTVSDGSGCSKTAVFSVTQNIINPVLSATVTAAVCNQNNGAVNLTVTPLNGNFYNWSNGAVSEDLGGVAPGIYTVTVTTSNNCTATLTTTVSNSGSTISISGVTLPNTSCTQSNGNVDITVTPTGTYNYAWTGGTTTEDLTNLSAGTYTVTVSDAAGCSSVAAFTVVEIIVIPTLTSTEIPAGCSQNNGAIDLTVTPAGGNTFTWSNGAVSEDLSGVAAGIYTVTVTTANNCTATLAVTVANSGSTISISGVALPNTFCTQPNGNVDITVTPTGTYNYAWTGGTTTEDLTSVSAGTYTVTVSDAAGCSSVAAFTVVEIIVNPTLTSTEIPAGCSQNNGAINLTVTPSGGNTFSWSNGAVSEDLSGVAAGIYTVTVTTANNCTTTLTATVANSGSTISISGVALPNIFCTQPNGNVDITVTPTGTYNYAWTGGTTTEDLTNLSAGTYTVTVSDAAGCSSVAAFTVVENLVIPTLTATEIPAGCGQNNGAIDLAVTPSNGNTFTWSNGAVSEDLSGVAAGIYTVTVTTANNCTATLAATVTNSGSTISISGVALPNTFCTQPNGNVDITVTPTGTYNYAWTGGTTTEDLTNLSAGTYTVTVSDAAGCSSVAAFTVVESIVIPTLTSTEIPAGCGQNNGAIDLVVTPAGGNTFTWSNGAVSEDLSGVAAGIYTVTVTTANNCTATLALTINSQSGNFTILQLMSCSSLDTGTVQQVFQNQFGCDSVVVIHTVLSGPELANIDLFVCSGKTVVYRGFTLEAGSVMDYFSVAENTCDSIIHVEVKAFPETAVQVSTTPSCATSPTGTIEITPIAAGAASLFYALDSTSFQTTPEFGLLPSGDYSIWVKDANGCIIVESAEISALPITEIAFFSDTLSCTTNETVIESKLISGHPAFLEFSWADGTNMPWLEVNHAGDYAVTITDGCTITERSVQVMWAEDPELTSYIYVPNCFAPDAENANTAFRVYPNPQYELVSFVLKTFDRWGNELFSTKNWQDAWTGEFRGTMMNPGVYVWYIEADIRMCDGALKKVFDKGDVTIIR